MIVHADVESELLRVWTLISELSDQLQENRVATADLRSQADALKTAAMHSGTGYPLRRFNMDMTKEVFEEELEKLNTQFQAENQALLNDNKQISVLLKEYEQTLENVMSKFRVQAHSTQEHELALTRQYEQQLLSRESVTITRELEETAKISLGLARLSEFLRLALRSLGGEDPEARSSLDAFLPTSSQLPFPTSSPVPFVEDGIEATPDVVALERECELVRLEKENESLRILLQLRDQKDLFTLREEIVQEIRETYARRAAGAGQLESPFVGQGIQHSLTHNPGSGFGGNQGMGVGDDMRGSRMFSPGGGFRGLGRGAKRGIPGRGKSRMPAFLE